MSNMMYYVFSQYEVFGNDTCIVLLLEDLCLSYNDNEYGWTCALLGKIIIFTEILTRKLESIWGM